MASEKNAIIIPITLLAEGGGVENASAQSKTPALPKNEQEKKQDTAMTTAKSIGNASKAILVHAASQTAALALSGYGDITGNYVQGANIQTAISETGKIASAIALGWVGVATYAIDKGVQYFNYTAQMKKNERDAAFKQQRVYGTTMKS